MTKDDQTLTDPNKQRDNRFENSARNAFASLLSTLLATLVPFAIRTLIRYQLGEDYLGLNSLFLSIIGILDMAELGIGAVMIYFLYEPVAQGNYPRISAGLNMLKKLYIRIGVIILIGGLAVTPFLTYLIKGENPAGSGIYLLFICYLVGTDLQYMLFPEIVSLSAAYQRKDFLSWINIISQIIMYTLQIIAIVCVHSYLLYIVSIIVHGIIVGILRKCVKNRYFPQIRVEGEISPEERKEITKNVLAMVGHQFDIKILGSVDNIFISVWLGLQVLAVYGNYFYVVTVVLMFMQILYNAALSSIGNALATEDVESNYERFKCMFLLNAFLGGWAVCCMLCMYNNFMLIWMGKTSLLGDDVVLVFCLYFYISQVRKSVQLFKDAGGMWYNDRLKPYVSIVVDLVLDIILIPRIGVIGAILSSVICLGIIELPWETFVLYRDYFHKGVKDYYLLLAKYTIIDLIAVGAGYLVCTRFISSMGIVALIVRFLICSVLSVGIMMLFYHKQPQMQVWINSIRGMLGKLKAGKN